MHIAKKNHGCCNCDYTTKRECGEKPRQERLRKLRWWREKKDRKEVKERKREGQRGRERKKEGEREV